MDQEHEDNFTLPQIDKKKTASDKAGELVVAVVVVAVAAASAVLIPLLVSDKL